MKKQMSYKKFRILVLTLDLAYFGLMIFLLRNPHTNDFMMMSANDDFEFFVWGLPLLIVVALNWQMFDEKYSNEKKKGVYTKNEALRNKRNTKIFKYFNILAISNLFLVGYMIHSLFNNIELNIPFKDYTIALSGMLFTVSIAAWILKLFLIKK